MTSNIIRGREASSPTKTFAEDTGVNTLEGYSKLVEAWCACVQRPVPESIVKSSPVGGWHHRMIAFIRPDGCWGEISSGGGTRTGVSFESSRGGDSSRSVPGGGYEQRRIRIEKAVDSDQTRFPVTGFGPHPRRAPSFSLGY